MEEAEPTRPACEAIEKLICQHVGFSMVAGAIPIPIVDIVAVTAIQMDMLRQMSNRYGLDFNEERGKSIAGALMGATLGAALGRIGASAFKAVPGIGTLLGIGSQVIFAGASTYAIGKVFHSHFDADGTMFNFDTEKFKNAYRDFMARGKEVAAEIQDDQSHEDILATIERLKELTDKGTITEEEFEASKKDLLAKLTE